MNSKSRRDVIRYGRILKCALLVVLFAFLAIVYSRENAKDVSMDKIEAQLIKKTNIEKLQKQKPRDLVQFIGLDANNYEAVLYYKSKEALSVDEVLVIKVRNKSDVKAVKDAVEKRITSQIEAFDNYGPEQVKELKNAIVTSRGKYVFYGVAKDPDKYEEVLLSVI
jgi:hypothetical protein